MKHITRIFVIKARLIMPLNCGCAFVIALISTITDSFEFVRKMYAKNNNGTKVILPLK